MGGQYSTRNIYKSIRGSFASMPASSNSLQIKHQMTQNYLVIWLDGNIDSNNPDCANTLQELRNIVNKVNLCTTSEQCIQFLNDMADEKAFIISSGSLGLRIMSTIHDMPQVDAIYIFCGNKAYHDQWAKEWRKIEGVFTSIEPICESLKKAAYRCDHDTIPMSFISKQTMKEAVESEQENLDQFDPSYMYSITFKEIILEMDEDEETAVKELIQYCRSKDILESEIEEFKRQYQEKSAIWCYTRKMFVYGMLNHALRTLDMEAMGKLGFFIRTLHRQLEQLHKQQSDIFQKQFIVYRTQGFVEEDFRNLQNSKGGFIAFNNFLSAHKEKNIPLEFIQHTLEKNPNIFGVLFIITIDPSKIAQSTIAFAVIDSHSTISTKNEILFTMPTVFRVNDIKQTNNKSRIWEVQLTLTDDHHPQLAVLLNRMKEQIDGYGWYRLGKLMLAIGHFNQAEELYNELLKNVSNDSNEAYIYQELGRVKWHQEQYDKAIEFYQKSLDIKLKSLGENHSSLVSCYTNIALVHKKTGNYQKALDFYKQAQKILEQTLPKNHQDLFPLYNSIAEVHEKMKDYSKSLQFYIKAFEISKTTLPLNQLSLALSHNNIGRQYKNMGEYPSALEFYEAGLEIIKKVLPSNHLSLAMFYNDIGEVHKNMHNCSKAISVLDAALAIRRKSLPSGHPLIQETVDNIQGVRKKM